MSNFMQRAACVVGTKINTAGLTRDIIGLVGTTLKHGIVSSFKGTVEQGNQLCRIEGVFQGHRADGLATDFADAIHKLIALSAGPQQRMTQKLAEAPHISLSGRIRRAQRQFLPGCETPHCCMKQHHRLRAFQTYRVNGLLRRSFRHRSLSGLHKP
jgi:hypothetical protein